MTDLEKQKEIAQTVYTKLKQVDPYAVLAGGAPRDWYFGEIANDLDFYFYSTGVTINAVENQLTNLLGVSVKVVPYSKDADRSNYKSMPFLRRVLECEVEGQKIQFMQLTEPSAQFKVVDAMSVSICKIWCTPTLELKPHTDFLKSVTSKSMFLSEGYNWSDKHPSKVYERFQKKFGRSTKEKVNNLLIEIALKGLV